MRSFTLKGKRPLDGRELVASIYADSIEQAKTEYDFRYGTILGYFVPKESQPLVAGSKRERRVRPA